MIEEDRKIKTEDGVADAFFVRPDGPGPFPGAVMYMDGLGFRPALKDMARRLAGEGYAVLLPNTYYRWMPPRPADFGKDRDKIMGYIAQLRGLIRRDAPAYLDTLAADKAVKPGKMGVFGYCMGATLSLITAGTNPARVAAAGLFHGAALATTEPDSPHLLLPQLRARLYIAVAAIDPWLAEGETERLKKALADAKIDHKLELYEGVEHGFAPPDTPMHDKAASERHWTNLLKLFKETL